MIASGTKSGGQIHTDAVAAALKTFYENNIHPDQQEPSRIQRQFVPNRELAEDRAPVTKVAQATQKQSSGNALFNKLNQMPFA